MLPLTPGVEIDGFVIGERLHRGGMASLWTATKQGIDTPLILKAPHLGEGEDPAAIVSFEMEQMIVPRLTGPHVPRCFGVGDFARQPYIAMERISGHSLFGLVKDLPLDLETLVGHAAAIADALDDLHRQQVIHLDIKPSNIMLREDGSIVLIDFGLSWHGRLPDLLAEDFVCPMAPAPIWRRNKWSAKGPSRPAICLRLV